MRQSLRPRPANIHHLLAPDSALLPHPRLACRTHPHFLSTTSRRLSSVISDIFAIKRALTVRPGVHIRLISDTAMIESPRCTASTGSSIISCGSIAELHEYRIRINATIFRGPFASMRQMK